MENLISHKTCSRCGISQSLDNFYKVKRTKPKVRNVKHDDHKAMCKGCYKQRAAEWAAKNPEKRKAIARKWDAENSEKRKMYVDAYNHKDEVKEKRKQWRKENTTAYLKNKRNADLLFAFKFSMRTKLNKIFARFGYTKRSKSNEIFGCDWNTLKNHIERQFKPGMTWDNRSEWHIDHIIPLASAKTEEDVIKLNHYTNLQPLWAHENLKKSDKIESLV